MAIKSDILGDPKAFQAWMADLSELEHKQLPFALSLAINDVVFAARKKVIQDYPSHFKGGINYLRKTMRVDKSHKKQPVISATLGEATGYMGMQQWGYNKSATSGKDMAIPTKAARKIYATKSGKMKKSGWPSKLTRAYKGPIAAGKRGGRGRKGSKKDPTFPMVSNGKRYIVMRKDRANKISGSERYQDGALIFLYHYVDRAKVSKAWAFDRLVIGEARRLFPAKLARHLARAVRTAK